MTDYRVHFHSDIQWAVLTLQADTPEQAVELARQFADEHFDDLDFESYQGCDCPINQIEVCDDEYNSLAKWYDDDMRLRLAARELLDAAELVVARWERGDLADAVRELSAAIAKAKGGAA